MIANKARRTLIRFGKSCPFVLCFIILISDLENLYAIITNNIVCYEGVAIYNTPISFAIGSVMEYDIFIVCVIALISISIEACAYNIMAIAYILLLLIRKHYLFYSEPLSDMTYIGILTLCAIISSWFIYRGIKFLLGR